MPLSLLAWNIHQQGGQRPIPSFVKKEVVGADLAVLIEFCTKSEGRHMFISDMTHERYRCAVSENTGGNDILIAAKTCFPILDCSWVPCRGVDSIPENLRVDLDCGGRVLSVVGIRIKSLDRLQSCDEKNQLRQRQFRWALDWIKDIQNPVLITGDFNNNRRGSENPDWSLDILRELLENRGFQLYTPKGGSIFEEHSKCEFPYDHFAAKGTKVSRISYDRDFTRHDPRTYIWGRDFRKPRSTGEDYQTLPSVAPPFPDHAILKGTLQFS